MTNAEAAALEYRVKQRDEALHEIELLLSDMGIAPGTQLRLDGRKVYGVTPELIETVEESQPENEPHGYGYGMREVVNPINNGHHVLPVEVGAE